jgi:hypothetical protein
VGDELAICTVIGFPNGYRTTKVKVYETIDAIENGAPLVAPGMEGIRGLTISNAMHLSSWLGKEIEIASFDHDKFHELLMERVKTSRRRTEVKEVKVDMSASFGKEKKDEDLYLRNGLGRGL